MVRHGFACDCNPGDQQKEACGDCGTRSRGCDQSCGWGGWSACGGPDPGGGNIACPTGEVGVCADGRQRCVDGNTQCMPLVAPSPEVCDGLDNDCNGSADDGNPQLRRAISITTVTSISSRALWGSKPRAARGSGYTSTTAKAPDGTWNDAPCDGKHAYVCEDLRAKAPDPGDACDACPTAYEPGSMPVMIDGGTCGGASGGAPDGGVP